MSVLRRLVNLARGTVRARMRREPTDPARREPPEDPPPAAQGSDAEAPRDAHGTDERHHGMARKRRL